MAASDVVGRSGRAAPGGILFLANAVAGLVLLVDEVLRWTRGPAPDLPAIARMATFFGILALGIAQFIDSRERPRHQRAWISLVAAIWLLAWSVTWFVVR